MVSLLCLLLLTALSAACPSGYTYFNSTQKCYKVVEDPYPYFAALDACSLDGAELVSIHNAFENKLIPDSFMDHWIGLTNMIDGWEYTWQDNSPVNYVHWAPGQPNPDQGCVVMKTATYTWEAQACSNQLPFICILDPSIKTTCPICPTFSPCPTCPPPPVCNTTMFASSNAVPVKNRPVLPSASKQQLDSVCPPGYSYVDSMQRCYKVVGIPTTFFGASSACNLDNAELVSIHSLDENQSVGDLLPGADFDKLFWIGLTKLVDNWGQWSWLDDTPVRYANWAPANPNTTKSCTTFHMLGYQWTTELCTLTLPYICEFDPTRTHNCPACPTPTPCPVCPTYEPCPEEPKSKCDNGWTYYDKTEFCYFVGHEGAVVNGDAQNQCKSRGAYLASIHSDAENSFIMNSVYAAVLNPGPIWIGAYRTGSGRGNFANYDGTPMDYTHWSSREPNNMNNNEYCVEMYLRSSVFPDGYWNDIPCGVAFSFFVCKKPSNMQ